MDFDSNSHSVFSLYYHQVLIIKYRREVIDDVSIRLKDIFDTISKKYNITTVEWEHDRDHVHVLFKAHANSELLKFINTYKNASNRLIKKEFP